MLFRLLIKIEDSDIDDLTKRARERLFWSQMGDMLRHPLDTLLKGCEKSPTFRISVIWSLCTFVYLAAYPVRQGMPPTLIPITLAASLATTIIIYPIALKLINKNRK